MLWVHPTISIMDTSINCGCLKCNVPCAPSGTCLRRNAYEEKLEKRGYGRCEELATMDVGFRPATQEQIEDWASWLSTPEAASAAELLHFAANSPAYETYKFKVAAMEEHLDNLFPEDKANFLIGPMWLSYQHYMKEQYELKKVYDSVKADEVEEAYKAILQHINVHGQLIREIPNAPTKMKGRRQ